MSHKHSIMINQIFVVDIAALSVMLLTAFKNVLASSNLAMTLSFWYISTNKNFKPQITLHLSITSFVLSSKTSLDKSLLNLQVKLDNLSLTMAIPSATESRASAEWSFVCLSVPMFVNSTSKPMNVLWISIFNKSAY